MPVNPWVILGLVVFWLASIVGADRYGAHQDSLAYEAQIAQNSQKAEAAALAANQKVIAANEAAVAASAKLEAANVKAQTEINAEHDRAIASIDALGVRVESTGHPADPSLMPKAAPAAASAVWPPPGCGFPRAVLIAVADRERDADDVLAIARIGQEYGKLIQAWDPNRPAN